MWPDETATLTRRERAIATYAEQFPLQFATQSGADIAFATHTSEASVARTARRLGFANVREMKTFCASRVQEAADLQSVLTTRLEALGREERETSEPSAVGSMPTALRASAQLVLGIELSVDWTTVDEAAVALCEAPRTLIYGLGTALSLAEYAEIELSRIGIDARALSGGGHANAHAAFQLSPDDALLILAPRVIFSDVRRFAAAALRTTSRVFVVSQASLPSDLQADGTRHLRLPTSNGSGATEAVSTIALLDAMVAEVARRTPQRSLEARARAQAYRNEFSDQSTPLPRE